MLNICYLNGQRIYFYAERTSFVVLAYPEDEGKKHAQLISKSSSSLSFLNRVKNVTPAIQLLFKQFKDLCVTKILFRYTPKSNNGTE